MSLDEKKQKAENWFRELRDLICVEFEKIERENNSDASFAYTDWQRPEGGGGTMGKMKGNIFEKVGVNISTVHGEFSEQFRKEIPGAVDDPRFWATGISLVAHMQSPLVSAVHMNTRMIVTGNGGSSGRVGSHPKPERVSSKAAKGAALSAVVEAVGQDGKPIKSLPSGKVWFGGGSDLNPAIPNDEDTKEFHAAFKATCDATDPTYHAKFKQWCDEYFFNKHRNEPRGVGGIFYDYLDTDWEKHFAFTQSVGQAFLKIYPKLVRRHMHEKWTEAQRHTQLVKRGRYAEFNLLHDRGTRFGLMTGGNPDAILMSLPPLAVWD